MRERLRFKNLRINLFYPVLLMAVTAFGCFNRNQALPEFETSEFYQKKFAVAIAHFSVPKDSLKLRALDFILDNLSDQYYYQGNWINIYNKEINESHSITTNFLIKKLDSIKLLYPHQLQRLADQNVVDNSYLIKSIDEAFAARQYPWAKDMSFTDFCEYILPYKTGNEKPEDWRSPALKERYLKNDSLLKDVSGFAEVANINNHLNWFRGTLNYDYPIDIGYQMTRKIATGSCYTISRMALFQMRSLGLPVVIDYTPCWGNRSEGHYWNAFMYKGKPYPFDPTGPNIGYYKIEFKGIDRISYKIAKVFRETFSTQKNSLGVLKTPDEVCPNIFDNKRIKDVTADYAPVSDVTLNFQTNFQERFAYLYIFNDKTWAPCYWGETNGNKVTFKSMGKDIVYLPALYLNGNQIIPLGDPFILTKNGAAIALKADLKVTQTLTITKKYPEDETNKIKKGDLYELFYWDGNWKSLGTKTANENVLYYYKVPVNALFLVRDLTQGKQERIFTYEKNNQVWW